MSIVLLSIPEPIFCFGASVGAVELIKLLRQRLNCGLAEAKRYVDRCVFDGETVALKVETIEAAEALKRALLALRGAPRLQVEIIDAP